MMNMWTANQLDSGPKQELRQVAEELQDLVSYLEHQQPAATPSVASGQQRQAARAWRLAVQHARVLRQHVQFNEMMPDISAASEFRDRSMAENVRWLVDYNEGAKTILWAANAHILAAPGSGSMGDLLRQTYGDDMVFVAFLRNRKSEGLAPDETDPGHGAHEGSVEAFLTTAGLDKAVFDLRSLPRGAVSKYFDAPRQTGAVSCLFPEAYDAILFLESTTNARLLKKEILSRAVERLPAPANLDFEELDDGSPKDWRAQGGQARLEFQTTGSHDRPYQGRTCGMIQRVPGRPFGEPFGNLVQRTKASDFQGQTIKLSAAARVTEGIAYLWLSVDVRNAPTVFRQQIVTLDQWQKYTLQAEVPQNAFRIAYGLAYVGQAAAFIDDVTIATPAH